MSACGLVGVVREKLERRITGAIQSKRGKRYSRLAHDPSATMTVKKLADTSRHYPMIDASSASGPESPLATNTQRNHKSNSEYLRPIQGALIENLFCIPRRRRRAGHGGGRGRHLFIS